MKDFRTQKKKWEAHLKMVDALDGKGFLAMGMFMFFKGGKIYDLSAADIAQIDRIEREGLFVISQ